MVPDFVARGRAEEARRRLRVGMTRAEVLAAVQPLAAAVEDCDPAGGACRTLKLEFRCWAYAYAVSVYFGPDGRTEQASQIMPVVQ